MSTSQAGNGNSNRSEPSVPELDASRFEMLEAVGSGGMGTVYRAVQRSVGRNVAVKVLAPEHAANATGLQRFVREANIIARLTHPNIVQLIDFGRDRDGRLLLVMELLEGESLRAVLRREGRMAPERAVYAAVQVLNALRVAHAAGVVHRDLKPENVFIHRSGDDDHVKVLDFGVAKLTQGDTSDANTTQGSLVGTLRYMAPEQIAGEAPDLRIDIYAVGMLLYEMVAGGMPYDTRDRYVLLRQIIAEEPMHLLARAPDVAPALAEVVMRAIQKSPRDRYQTADEFRKALTPYLGADHARLQALADASGRASSTNPGAQPSGEIRSGVVRSGHIQVPASNMAPTFGGMNPSHSGIPPQMQSSPGYPVGPGYASSPGYPSAPGYASAPGYPIAPPQPFAPLVSQPPPPAPTRAIWVIPLAILVAAAAIAGGIFATRPQATRATPPQTTPTQTTAAPVQPAAATAMVTVTTTPSGARVSSRSGAVLCETTPCAIPAPAGAPMPVRIAIGAVTLDATLDPSTPSASIDLTALLAPSTPPQTAPVQVAAQGSDAGVARRVDRRRNTGNTHTGQGEQGGGDLPMFLPR